MALPCLTLGRQNHVQHRYAYQEAEKQVKVRRREKGGERVRQSIVMYDVRQAESCTA